MYLDIPCGGCTGNVQKQNVITVMQERKGEENTGKPEPPQTSHFVKGRYMGGFQMGGFPDLDLSFLSWRFFVLFCPPLSFLGPGRFSGISQFARGWSGEEEYRKGPRHNLDLSRKKWETPPVRKPPRFSFSQFCRISRREKD